jgi:uncharacterized protein YggT (Ycf19 family)
MATAESTHSGWLTVGKVAKVLLWLVYAWLLVTLALLMLAFVLLLFGASPDAAFVEWVYRSTERAMAPFRGMFQPVPLGDASVLDTSLLFAAIIYTFLALLLRAAIDWLTARITAAQRPALPPPDRRSPDPWAPPPA